MSLPSGKRSLAILILPGIFILFSFAATWPTVAQIGEALPIGSESSGTVPFLNAWILEWNRQNVLDPSLEYWNAPIFHPSSGALAFSEPQPGTILVTMLTGAPGVGVGYNTTLFVYLLLNSLSAFWLFRKWDLSLWASILGAALFQILPYLSHERGVLQLQVLFPFLLGLRIVEDWADEDKTRYPIILGILIAGTFYLSEAHGFVFLLGIGLYTIVRLIRHPALIKHLAVLFGTALIFVFPLLGPQQDILEAYKFTRSQTSIEAGSAEIADLMSPSETIFASKIQSGSDSNFGLYPGILLTLLAAVQLILWAGKRKWPSFAPGLLFLFVFSFLLTLGLNLKLGQFRAYPFLVDNFPGFNHIRSPFRFGIWMQLIIAIQATILLSRFGQKIRWLAIVIFIIAAVEIFPLPAKLAPLPEKVSLERANSPALFIPYVRGRSATAYTETTRWMLIALENNLLSINGYSGYFPTQNQRLKTRLENFPDLESLRVINEMGVESILIASDWITPEMLEELQSEPFRDYFQFTGEFGKYSLFNRGK